MSKAMQKKAIEACGKTASIRNPAVTKTVLHEGLTYCFNEYFFM